MTISRYGLVSGRVQGVGFRYFVQRCAEARSLTGWARNLDDGRVEVLLCGDEVAVAAVQIQVAEGPVSARVDSVHWAPWRQEYLSGFTTG